jgi:Flp pilus assembly protein TadG
MPHVLQLVDRLKKDQRGAALVEMAIITPLVVLLAAGVFEFSSIIQTRLMLEAGVSDGARFVARCRWGGNQAACETAAINIVVTGQPTSGGTARVTGWTAAQVAVTYTPFAVTVDSDGLQNYRTDLASVDIVSVTATYPYSGTGLWAFLGFGAFNLVVSHQERVIGA